MTNSDILIRRATADDAALVARVASDTFPLACPPGSTPEAVDSYIAGHLTESAFESELQVTGVAVYLACIDDVPIGYAVLRGDSAPPPGSDLQIPFQYARPAQLRRLYVQREYHGAGIAHALLRRVVRHARTHAYDLLWLATHESNKRAIAFYTRHKFVEVGFTDVQVGPEGQCDLVLARPVA